MTSACIPPEWVSCRVWFPQDEPMVGISSVFAEVSVLNRHGGWSFTRCVTIARFITTLCSFVAPLHHNSSETVIS